MSAPVRPDPDDPARRPRPLGQRLGLLLILLILPVTAVTVPTLLVTGFFGNHPRPKAAPAVDGLGDALDLSAQKLLPTPAPLTPEPLRLTVRPARLAARAAKITTQAQALGGSAVEGISDPGEKHLYVDLPGGRGPLFRQAVLENTAPSPPAGSTAAGAARDQLEVILHGDDDE